MTTAIGDGAIPYRLILDNNKIIIAGNSYSGGTSFITVARFTANGDLDTTFDSDGYVTTAIGTGAYAYDLAVDTSSNIIVVGNSVDSSFNTYFTVVRYNSSGALDSSFGSGGYVTTNIGGNNNSCARSLFLFNDKIVVGGVSLDSSGEGQIALVRYNSDGSLDPSFGSGGICVVDNSGRRDLALRVLLQPDNKIIAVGYTILTETNYAFLLARIQENGEGLDNTFGEEGIIITNYNPSNLDVLFCGLIQPHDLKIIAGGFCQTGPETACFCLVRYK